MQRSPRSKESDTRMFLGNAEDKDLAQTRSILALPPLQFDNSLNATLNSWPFFGGDGEGDDNNDDENNDGNNDDENGNSAGGEDDKPLLTNKEINDLLDEKKLQNKKIDDLTKSVATLQKEQDKVNRSSLSKEENLQKDLDEANGTIEGLKKAIQNQALLNAVQSNDKLKFQSVPHVIREIDPNMISFDLDLESRTATVTGVDAELKRISRDLPWMLKKEEEQQQQQQQQQQFGYRPGSGAPPAPGNNNNKKQTARAALMAKFPVIAHGTRPNGVG